MIPILRLMLEGINMCTMMRDDSQTLRNMNKK